MLLGISLKDKRAIYMRAPCKRWNCEVCGARNANRWIARTIQGVNSMPDKKFKMVTITANGKTRSKSQSLWNLRVGWPRLIRRIKYHDKSAGTYLRVIEPHKDGAFHIHGIMPIELSRSDLKAHAASSGLGWNTHYRNVDNAGYAASYVAKYLAKGLAIPGAFGKGMRRINTSRDWPELEERDDERAFDRVDVIPTMSAFESAAYELWGEGFQVWVQSTGELLTSDSIGLVSAVS